MLTCYIVDDESWSIESTTRHIDRMPNIIVIGNNTNPLIAIKEIKEKKPDIVFLDVEMPELSGIDVADLLPRSINTVFTTSHSKYALKAFEKDASDFLLKPFTFEQFVKCVNKLENKINLINRNPEPLENEKIFINTGVKGNFLQVPVDQIIYVKAVEHSITIKTIDDGFITRISLKEVEDKLPASKFSRVHKAYIVNIDLILSIEANTILMQNKTVIPFGGVYKKIFLDKIRIRTLQS